MTSNHVKNKSFKIIMLSLMCLFSATIFALAADQKQSIQLSSDAATCNRVDNANICIYKGNAKFDQGTTHLYAPQVTIYSRNNAIYKINATGKRSNYSTILDNSKKLVNAVADDITILLEEKTIILQGDGIVTEGSDKFSGPYIAYKIK